MKTEELQKEYENAMSDLLEKWREIDPGFVKYVEMYGGPDSAKQLTNKKE